MSKDLDTCRYVAMGPTKWGKGHTPEQAVKRCRDAGFRGRAVGVLRIFEAPANARKVYVDEIGCIRWTWATPEAELAHPVDKHGRAGRWGKWQGKRGVKWE